MNEKNKTTMASPVTELDRLQRRLLISKRWLEAFPNGLTEPSLIRRKRDGSGELEACPLQGELTIGRQGDEPFRYPAEMTSMSRQHFRIWVAPDGRCFVQVCESGRKNGLHVNGREVPARRLVHGDQIYAGGEEFVFSEGNASG